MKRDSTCAICGRACIPLADYDVPTCIGCDDAMEIVGEAAFAVPLSPPLARPATIHPLVAAAAAETARVYGALCRENRPDATTEPDYVIAQRRAVAESMQGRGAPHLRLVAKEGAA